VRRLVVELAKGEPAPVGNQGLVVAELLDRSAQRRRDRGRISLVTVDPVDQKIR
jgi:hypothetical protein